MCLQLYFIEQWMADDTVEVELNLDTDDEEQEIARRGAVFRCLPDSLQSDIKMITKTSVISSYFIFNAPDFSNIESD